MTMPDFTIFFVLSNYTIIVVVKQILASLIDFAQQELAGKVADGHHVTLGVLQPLHYTCCLLKSWYRDGG